MKVKELLERTHRLIGTIAAGEALEAVDAQDSLVALNELLESWSNDGLLIFSSKREEFNLTAGQQTYTIGSGGNFNTVKPIELKNVGYLETGIETPINLINTDEWASISDKSLSGTPTDLYLEKEHPLAKINLHPIPQAGKLVLYSNKPFSGYTSLNDEVGLPVGYSRALRYNLAMDLATEYGRPITQRIEFVANETLADLKRSNSEPVVLKTDFERNTFNILTGV